MPQVWQDMIGNLGVVGLLVAVCFSLQPTLERAARRYRDAVIGGLMGMAGLSSMFLAVPLQPGILFDLRTPLVAIGALFGGPLGAAAAGLPVIAARTAIGGQGLGPAVLALLASVIAGLICHRLAGGRPRLRHAAAVALVVVAATFSSMLLLPPASVGPALTVYAPPTAILGAGVTMIVALVLVSGRRVAEERHLLHAALAQAPDYFYVKDSQSRFVAVSHSTARHNGFSSAPEMIGLTDDNLTSPERAAGLRQEEARLLEVGVPILDKDEQVTDSFGKVYWYSTTKTPIRDQDGCIIGLVGTSRDVTHSRELEQELRANRDLLTFAFSEMSDGLAMFDQSGVLIYCNSRYRAMFPLTAGVRQHGIHLRKILQAVIDTGEQLNIDNPNRWMDTILGSLRSGGEEQVQLYDGRWLHLRTRTTASGSSLVVVSDVSEIKKRELELQATSNRLEVEVLTDGLTGILNRRAFDLEVQKAISLSADSGEPLSLLLLDVDKFKAYNDIYGHLAGDDCLRAVAGCLKLALHRTGDLAFRYGGEEFAAILPNTCEDDAFAVADRFRMSLAAMALPHVGGAGGIVTISGGISGMSAGQPLTARQLVERADEALYDAKGAGRNRILGWSTRRLSRQSAS